MQITSIPSIDPLTTHMYAITLGISAEQAAMFIRALNGVYVKGDYVFHDLFDNCFTPLTISFSYIGIHVRKFKAVSIQTRIFSPRSNGKVIHDIYLSTKNWNDP